MSGPRRPNGKQDRLQRAYERGRSDAEWPSKTDADNPFAVNEHRVAWKRGFDEVRAQ